MKIIHLLCLLVLFNSATVFAGKKRRRRQGQVVAANQNTEIHQTDNENVPEVKIYKGWVSNGQIYRNKDEKFALFKEGPWAYLSKWIYDFPECTLYVDDLDSNIKEIIPYDVFIEVKLAIFDHPEIKLKYGEKHVENIRLANFLNKDGSFKQAGDIIELKIYKNNSHSSNPQDAKHVETLMLRLDESFAGFMTNAGLHMFYRVFKESESTWCTIL